MENAGQLACLRASVRECGFDKKMRANPARCGTLDRSVGETLFNFKTVEALRGAFFFSTGVELNTKDAGGGGGGWP